MKIVLAIACGLLLVWAQAWAVSTPVVDRTVAHHCGCGGTMPCCKAASTSHSLPVDATAPGDSQHILSLVPATVVWVLAATRTSSVTPSASYFLKANAAPLFARNCVRLI